MQKLFLQRQIWLFMSFRCTIIGLTGTLSKMYDAKCLEAGMSDVLLKPITRKILLAKLELWTQNKATARKTQQQLSQNKATDEQLQCSNDSPAAYSSKVASMPLQKFKAVVFGKIVFGVCTCSHDGYHSFVCFSFFVVQCFRRHVSCVSQRACSLQTRIRPLGWFSRAF